MTPSKISKTITMAGGGNETFADLKRGISDNGSIGIKFVDSSILATVTINMEISYDGSDWATLVDADGDNVTGTLASSGELTFSLVDIPPGAQVRPKFVTDTTGDIVVTSWA